MIKPRKPILHWARLVAAKFLKELPISQLYESCFRCDHPFLVHLYPHYLHICIKRNKHNIRVITLKVLCYILYTEKEIFVCYVLNCFSLVLTLCDLMGCSPTGSSVHGILQARILGWVAVPFSRASSWPKSGTLVSCISCTGRQILYHCYTRSWKTNNLSEVVEWPVCNYTIANKWTEVWLCFREISLK